MANDAFLDTIETLSHAKSMAENRVRLLRALVEDGELMKSELRPIKNQYGVARANVNAAFDRILVALETTSRAQPTESFEELAQLAKERAQAFTASSDVVILGKDRSDVAAAAVEATSGLFGSLVDIWKTLRAEKKSQRGALITRVEALKWVAFDDVA
jgi:hypothetical protein